jgi:hypothetical protein
MNVIKCLAAVALCAAAGAAADPFGDVSLTLQPFDPGANLLPNASFEEAEDGRPAGWRWDPRNTDAMLALDAAEPHSGRTAVRITNGTAFGAHVYGTLWLERAVPVKPATVYTLSAFVKSGGTAPGAWMGGGEGWKVRRSLPATHGQWRRVSHTFTTGEKETAFTARVCTDRPTKGFWLDDLSLREGARPVPGALEGAALADSVDLVPAEPPEVLHHGHAVSTRWAPQRWPADAWAFCTNEFRAEGVVTVADASRPAAVEVELADADGKTLARRQAPLAAGTRAAFLTLRAELGDAAPEKIALTVKVVPDLRAGTGEAAPGGRRPPSDTREVNIVTPARIRKELDAVQALAGKIDRQRADDYRRVALTVLDNFIPWVEEDIKHGKLDRAWDTASLLADMAPWDGISKSRPTTPVPRYRTGPLEISRAQTLGTRRFPDGRSEHGPVFFVGYGHFGQVKRDIEKFPGYGCNLVQVEFGPSAVLPAEDRTSDSEIDRFLQLCDRAAASDVAVNLLLSPHYFPRWALEKWPHLTECHGGFFKYCVHDPAARAVIEKSLRQVIPRIKDHPALHSVCLSNEPVCVDLSRCRVAAEAWPAWLEKRHGAIATLNVRWGAAHADFASIPVPKPEFEATPACLDFLRFNCETFAAFHKWMADVVHSVAPELPVHAKIMMGAHFQKTLHGFWSADPAAFAALSQYNGNDAYNMLDKEGALWANGWRHCQAGYDFQRGVADLPVFNSENHLIVDRESDAIPPAHLYSVLWQQAVHGQSSTTLWVWERCNDYVSDSAGSILHRPDCVEAVGRCALDLNRLAHEVATLQNLAPSVVLLWSPSSVVLGHDHEHALGQAYEAASFLGQPLGFATEEKLAEFARTGVAPRPLDTAKALILPQVTHLPDGAREGVEKLAAAGVCVVVIGDAPERNDYGRAVPLKASEGKAFETLPKAGDSAALFAALSEQASAWGLPEVLRLTDAAGRPFFGVEIRSAPFGDGFVASVCNHLREARTVSLAGGEGRPLTDLITGRALGASFTAEPMVPLLIRCPSDHDAKVPELF